MSRSLCLVYVVAILTCVTAEIRNMAIPSYLQPHLCRKSDPMLSACVNKSIENLRPFLVKGMPELNLATVEPLHFSEITMLISPKDVGVKDPTNFRAIARNIRCTGASQFKVHKLRMDIELLVFHVDVEFPRLSCEADYDVDVRVASLPIKGHGPIAGNATNIRLTALVLGELYVIEGIRHLRLNKVDIHLVNIGRPVVRIRNDYKGETILTESFSALINANSKMFIKAITPNFETAASRILMDISNESNKVIDFDEIFPN